MDMFDSQSILLHIEIAIRKDTPLRRGDLHSRAEAIWTSIVHALRQVLDAPSRLAHDPRENSSHVRQRLK